MQEKKWKICCAKKQINTVHEKFANHSRVCYALAMILYYSRTKKSALAAQALHEITGMPLYALETDINSFTGIKFGWNALRSVMSKKGYPVSNLPGNVPGEVYLCGPIWAGEMAGPLKYVVTNVDFSKTVVHVLLTGMQPSEQNRISTQKLLLKSGCLPGEVYLMATPKQMPEKEVVTEHLRALLGGDA